MKRYKIFKIKQGKREKWMAWCKEIMERYQEAKETLVEEDLVREHCVVFTLGDNSYVFYEHETQGDKVKKPMNLDKPINQQHKAVMEECLEDTSIQEGYEVKTNE